NFSYNISLKFNRLLHTETIMLLKQLFMKKTGILNHICYYFHIIFDILINFIRRGIFESV
ncbi:hypothetical protein EHH26_13680, partial [Enterococcus faecium]|nr:hypothetical protein [Enterococcus faecium]